MPFNWTLNNIKNYKKVCYEQITKKEYEQKNSMIIDLPRYEEIGDDATTNGKYFQMKTETNAILWAMLAVGIYDITEKNYKKVANRIKMREAFKGTMYLLPIPKYKQVKGIEYEPMFITEQQVKDHIGLSTNATRMTKAQFVKRLNIEL